MSASELCQDHIWQLSDYFVRWEQTPIAVRSANMEIWTVLVKNLWRVWQKWLTVSLLSYRYWMWIQLEDTESRNGKVGVASKKDFYISWPHVWTALTLHLQRALIEGYHLITNVLFFVMPRTHVRVQLTAAHTLYIAALTTAINNILLSLPTWILPEKTIFVLLIGEAGNFYYW